MKAAPTAAFQNLSTLCIQSFLRNLSHRRKPKRRLHRSTICSAHNVRKIDYPGSNNRTEFTFDCLSDRAKIVEVASGTVTSTKQYVANEERDAGGSVTKKYFKRGVVIGSTNYFYERDHLGSIRQLTDSSGNVITAYFFRPYGEKVTLAEAISPDIQYAGYYFHARSGLSLTDSRAYSPSLAAWLSRDPIEEGGGDNLYAYVGGNPISRTDPLGLKDHTEQETNDILKKLGDEAGGIKAPFATAGAIFGYLDMVNNSTIFHDYGYSDKTMNDTFCIKGKKLNAFQFTNFFTGYTAQIWDSAYAPISRAAYLSVQAGGAVYHLLSAGLHGMHLPFGWISVGWDDPFNKRGAADIRAGVRYARNPSADLPDRYKNCCEK